MHSFQHPDGLPCSWQLPFGDVDCLLSDLDYKEGLLARRRESDTHGCTSKRIDQRIRLLTIRGPFSTAHPKSVDSRNRARFCLLPPVATLKTGPRACPFLDESIRNVVERDSRKPFSPPLPQAVTPFASGLRRNQMVPEQHSPQTPPSSRENFF
ncbi:hypothetical protein TNCV_4218141 [Trichonephila clavipes]|nr:hypothetical protein TNCV_4218141 [Trichonephila clavipes]